MPKPKKIQYGGESKIVGALVGIANWLLDNMYELPIAGVDVLGGIKVGNNLSIDENGVLSAIVATINALNDIGDVNITNPTDGQLLKYDSDTSKWKNGEIPAATTNSLGLVKIGSGLSVYNGNISADNQVFNNGKTYLDVVFSTGWANFGDPIYVYEPGLYLIAASADYGYTVSSGEIGIRVRVGVSGSSETHGETRQTIADPANERGYINTFVVVQLTASTSTISVDCYAGTSEYIRRGKVYLSCIRLKS